ncbi:MAG: tetratricopeptide repeat protein [Pseudomonadota bacterium]
MTAARTGTKVGAALLALLALAACQPTGGFGTSGENNPPAADAKGQGVDGLIVGHRLMAAGEYELALRAYLRAAAQQGVNVDTLSALGSANLKLGRLGQAEQLLRRALEEDGRFVPALNNLGVVLMERGKAGEARVYFQQAFALDSGQSDSIRENLKRAIAQSESTVYDSPEEKPRFNLVRRGNGEYLLLSDM